MHDWKEMYPDPDYPHDLYDEERNSLKRLKASWFFIGAGVGIMSCAAFALILGWLYG